MHPEPKIKQSRNIITAPAMINESPELQSHQELLLSQRSVPKKDVEFGFEIVKLGKAAAARVADMLIQDMSKKIGSKYQQIERQKREEALLKAKEAKVEVVEQKGYFRQIEKRRKMANDP